MVEDTGQNDEHIAKPVEPNLENLSLVEKVLFTSGGFDGRAGLITRGVCFDKPSLRLMGYPTEKLDVEIDREGYKRKNEIASLDHSDFYDFWLLSHIHHEVFFSRSNWGPNTAKIKSDFQDRYSQAVTFVGQGYLETISQAMVREYLVYEKQFFENEHEDSKLIIGEKYLSVIRGESGSDELVAAAKIIADVKRSHYKNLPPEVLNSNGWYQASLAVVRLDNLLNKDQKKTRGDIDEIATEIDGINNTFHANAGMASHMIDQSRKDEDLLAFCESFMKGNEKLLYEKSSDYIKELYMEVGGLERLKKEQSPLERGTDEYYKELEEVLIMLLNTEINEAQQVDPGIIVAGLTTELTEQFGSEEVKSEMKHLISSPRIKEAMINCNAKRIERSTTFNALSEEDIQSSAKNMYETDFTQIDRITDEYKRVGQYKTLRQIVPTIKSFIRLKSK